MKRDRKGSRAAGASRKRSGMRRPHEQRRNVEMREARREAGFSAS